MHPSPILTYSHPASDPLSWMHPGPAPTDALGLARSAPQWGSAKKGWGGIVVETNPVETYRRIADVLRSAQRVAIEVENAPDKRKRLRTFSTQEVAALLGVKAREIASHTKSPNDRPELPRNRLAFSDILELRKSLYIPRGTFGSSRDGTRKEERA